MDNLVVRRGSRGSPRGSSRDTDSLDSSASSRTVESLRFKVAARKKEDTTRKSSFAEGPRKKEDTSKGRPGTISEAVTHSEASQEAYTTMMSEVKSMVIL